MNPHLSSFSQRRSITVPAPTSKSGVIRKGGPITNQVTGEVVYPKDRCATTGAAELTQAFASLTPKPISAVGTFIQPLAGAESTNATAKKPRKKRTKPQGPEYHSPPLNELKWLTIAHAAILFPGFSEKAIRHLVAQAEAYAKYPKANLRSNGFLPCIVRPAGQRKILIDSEKFKQWLSSNQMGEQS